MSEHKKVTAEEYGAMKGLSVTGAQNRLRLLVAQGKAKRTSEPRDGRLRYVYELFED
jgi:predicted transcriptional regulator